MRTIISILLLISSFLVRGQKDTLFDNKFCIKTSPLSLLDVYGGNSYRIGTEIKIYRNFAISTEGGGYIRNGLTGFTNARGFILKPELKFYLNRHHKTTGKFISAEYQYKNISFDYTDSISIPKTKIYNKKYTIHKDINCFTLKFGELFSFSNNRLILEWHAGLGVRIVNSYSNLTSDEEKGIYRPGDQSTIYSLITGLGFYYLPNFDIGLKIGYRFK